MLLLKIPIIVLETVCFQFAGTSPTKAVPRDRQPIRNIIENLAMALYARGGMSYLKYLYWVDAFAEVASMIGTQYPKALLLPSKLFLNVAGKIEITSPFLIGSMLVITGSLIRVLCYRTLGRHYTYEVSILDRHKLITSGPYAVVRHPAYVGTIMIIVGAFLSRGTPGSWVRESGVLDTALGKLVFGLWAFCLLGIYGGVVLRVPSEDELLKKEFGKEWAQWAQRVRYRLVPGVY